MKSDYSYIWLNYSYTSRINTDIEILGWFPGGTVLPHGDKIPLKPWLGTLLVMVS